MSLCVETGKTPLKARREKIEILHHHIVVEGHIGVGKTSLAIKLAERINGRLLLENTEDNPYLDRFYRNPGKYVWFSDPNLLPPETLSAQFGDRSVRTL